MKKSLYSRAIALLFILITIDSHAQAPSLIPYQAVARNSSGNLIQNQSVSLRFTIHSGAAAGTIVYQETQTVTTSSLGLFSVNIGQGIPNSLYGAFSSIDWASASKFTQVEIDITGGTAFVDMGTQQMLSVPYALYAENSGRSVGAVVYAGTWDANANSPVLSSSAGTKGFYYVVTDAGSHDLNGITDWKVGDWAIYNGTAWEKVDNSDSPTNASDVSFTPAGGISATNVQDAIEELNTDSKNPVNITQDATHRFVTDAEKSNWNNKADKIIPATNGNFASLDASGNLTDAGKSASDYIDKANTTAFTPSGDYNPATKKYVDDASVSTQTNINTKVNKSGDTMTGPLILNSDPTTDLGAATKKYVDDTDNLKADKTVPATSGNFASLDASGNLTDAGKRASDYIDKANTTAYTPSGDYNPATKKYVDDAAASTQTTVNAKVNKMGDTMTGLLFLSGNPTTDLGAATKKYVDDADNMKADKTVPAANGNFASLSLSGDLVDGGPNTASNLGFTATPDITATNVQDAIQEVNGQFADLIDSYIHRNDDGVSIYLAPGTTTKRFGIGDTQPDAPLGIKSAPGGDDQMISFKSMDGSQEWNINLNPTGSNVPGFSIDDASSGTSTSRLFIDQVHQGKVGVGTVTPAEQLSVYGNADDGNIAIGITNSASGHNGWVLGHADDNAITQRNGSFSVSENRSVGPVERITVLPSANVGVNEKLPYATLHVTRPASDPQTDVALSENTGVLLLGPIDNKNLAFDSHQIQARTGSYGGAGTTLSFTATALSLQPLGGGIKIHNDMTADKQFTITEDGLVGLGKTPAEKLDVNGAITLGDANGTAPANGTIRWSGTDFEGRKSGNWVSLTAQRIFETGSPGTIYYSPASGEAKVGIGLSTPTSSLHISDNYALAASAVTARIESNSSTSSVSNDDHRIAMQISSSGAWSSNALSKNIGIYVSEVSGKSNAESNLAAVLNGNTVIGNLMAGNTVVGTGGRNVLAIQNGASPSSRAGSSALSDGGIQIYSESDAIGTSIFSVMNGDGSVVHLYRTAALTPADNAALSSSSYGSTESAVIENLRTRVNELEAKLRAMGLLQ